VGVSVGVNVGVGSVSVGVDVVEKGVDDRIERRTAGQHRATRWVAVQGSVSVDRPAKW
jgi:hypothetical protein